MPNKASAKKRVRQNEVRRIRNRARSSDMRLAMKKVRRALDAGELENIDALLQKAQSKVDKAAKTPILKKETGRRYISRLNTAVKKAKEQVAASS